MTGLSPSEKEKFLEFVQARMGHKRPLCPICRSNTMAIADSVYALVEFDSYGLSVGHGSSVVPVIPLVCTNCGYTLLVNALIAGLVHQAGKVQEASPESQVVDDGRVGQIR